ncbi:MAG: diacylglycerol kinase family lipid kinase [Gudongella sp.]|nr:diacylglycerol kinase family lipid kinase [Gudongella sp.]
MEKYLFIINPIAGSGKAKNFEVYIGKYMKDTEIDYKVIFTTKPKEATEIVINNPDYTICVAVGGDGTVGEVANGIIQRGHGILGIIPAGTGNDLSKSLLITNDIEKAFIKIINKNVKEIDLGRVDNRYFFNIASLGFDAEVVRHTDKIKKIIRGKTAYILGVLTSLLVYKSRNMNIEVDGDKLLRRATLVAIGNGAYYGGGMQILPMAKLDDGELDICIVKDISNLRILFLFPSIFKGQHIKYKKYIEFYRGKNIKVKVEGEMYLNIDGEISLVKDRDIDFYIGNEKLNIIV